MTPPVQVLVVGFDEVRYSGEVLAELSRLADAGVVRLVDVLLVRRDEDGSLQTLDPPDPALAGFGAVAAAFLTEDGAGPGEEATAAASGPGGAAADLDAAGWWSVADAVPVGGVAAVALVEHLWAGPLAAAIERNGGTPLDETWLAPADRTRLDALRSAAGAG